MNPRIETKQVEDLQPADYNPRRIDERALAGLGSSIDRFGVVEPIVWNERSGRIVGGHQRMKVLVARGIKETDVVVVNLDDIEEKALNVALNNPHIAGEFTEDLSVLLKEIDAVDSSLYEALRFDDLMAEIDDAADTGEVQPGDDEVPEPPAEPVARLGDIWLLGPHRIICGDSSDKAVTDRLFEGKKPSLLATDPPYGVDYVALTESRRYQKQSKWSDIHNDNLDDDGLRRLVVASLRAEGCHTAFVWYPFSRRALFESAVVAAGWEIRQEIIWVKNSLVLGRADYQWRHENCLYAKRKGAPRQEDRSQTTVWEVDKITGAQHPTQKPVEIFARAIRNHTQREDIVFDPFLGSGSCLIAAERTDRRCFGVELEPRYVDVEVARWQIATGKLATCERTDG